MSSLYRILENTGRLDAGEPGYSDARKLSGIVVEAIGRDGRPLLFVGVRGRKVSSNRYPYYEFLFTSDVAGGELKLISFQRVYFHPAGTQALEWSTFFRIFTFLGLIPTLMVQAVLLPRGRSRE